MADVHLKLPIGRITRDVTVHVDVTGYRAWRVRLRIATWLIRLSARVAGVGLRVTQEPTGHPRPWVTRR